METTQGLPLPPGDFDAYLFDLDGTLADSMPVHHRAWQETLQAYGADFPVELFYAWAGRPTPRLVEMLNEHHGLDMPVALVNQAREEAYLRELAQIQPIAGVVHHVHAAHGRLKLAVVSGSHHAAIVKTLDVLGLLDRFDAILGSEDYARGKPHPDPYLEAARLLGVEPARCLVFEDAELGIESARAAGMPWVRVPVSAPGRRTPSDR